MQQKHMTLLWQLFSVACLLFLLASIVSIQGGSEFIGKLLGDKAGSVPDNKAAVGYFGAIIGGGLFLLASSVLLLHACRHGDHWHDRVPVLWLEGLTTAQWDGKLYQAAMVLLFLVLPAAGILDCIAVAERGDICELDTMRIYKGSETTLLWPPHSVRPDNQMRLRRENSGNEECKSGIELLPSFGTPFLIYGIPALSGGMALAAALAIFMRRSQDKEVLEDLADR